MSGVTFSGGEPFCQAESFLALAKEVKKRNLDIVAFSGYTYDELTDLAKSQPEIAQLLDCIDLLIDGRYIKEERDLTLTFRGSRNQRIIDMNKTRETGTIVYSKYEK